MHFLSTKSSKVYLPTCVPSVDHNVSARCVRASITGEVQIDTFQLARVCITLEGCKAIPRLLHFKGTVSTDWGVNVARANTVHASKTGPFHGERLGKVNNTSFASIIASL